MDPSHLELRRSASAMPSRSCLEAADLLLQTTLLQQLHTHIPHYTISYQTFILSDFATNTPCSAFPTAAPNSETSNLTTSPQCQTPTLQRESGAYASSSTAPPSSSTSTRSKTSPQSAQSSSARCNPPTPTEPSREPSATARP